MFSSGLRKRCAFLFRNKGLLWKLCGSVAAGTVLLFWAVDILVKHAEQKMSHISATHRQEIQAYGREAEKVFLEQGTEALDEWLKALQEKEDTWASVARSEIHAIAGELDSERYDDSFLLGRSVDWKIHLYFEANPVMEVTFTDPRYHFLIRLPQRMRPGAYLPFTWILLQIALPLVLLIILSVVLYRHVMTPLRQLEKATRQFSEGQFDVRVKNYLGVRDDELAALAETFDQMAERTGSLILTQRQLLGDLSHELRTPLARMDMALDCIEQGLDSQDSLERLRYEAATMRQLVEDALTLAWLTQESPVLNQEEVDLNELLQLIIEDAQFEYPDSDIRLVTQDDIVLPASSHRALGQALENVIRNALKYSGGGGRVEVLVHEVHAITRLACTGIHRSDGRSVTRGQRKNFIQIIIRDEGPGVPDSMLEHIFEPFFRVDKARTDASGLNRGVLNGSERVRGSVLEHSPGNGGYGLGLALAKRQIMATGGQILARNRDAFRRTGTEADNTGLEMEIQLPVIVTTE